MTGGLVVGDDGQRLFGPAGQPPRFVQSVVDKPVLVVPDGIARAPERARRGQPHKVVGEQVEVAGPVRLLDNPLFLVRQNEFAVRHWAALRGAVISSILRSVYPCSN